MGYLDNWSAKLAYLLGRDADKAPAFNEGLGEHLLRLFGLLEINCVLDVGANGGQYGAFLRDIGYTGSIVSFEPVSSDYELLAGRAAKDTHWYTHQLALADEEGTLKINVTSDSLFNSFLTPNDFMTEQGLRVVTQELVEVKRLDSIFDACTVIVNDPRVYLKMDTQGYDLKVLAGAHKALGSILGLQSELSIQPLYDDMPDYLETLSTLRKAGFDVTAMFPIARDNVLRVIEFDCIMIRRDAVGEMLGVYPP